LLAVFDRLLAMLAQRAQGAAGQTAPAPPCPAATASAGWERLQVFLRFVLLTPPEAAEFHSLQYTFLSQIGHRDDFRRRLASLYEDWRSHMAADLTGGKFSPRTVATFVQALLHGLAMQRVADPGCYDRQEMLDLVLGVLGGVLGQGASPPRPETPAPPRKRGRRSPKNLGGEP